MRYLMMFGLAAVVIFTPLAGQNGPQTDLDSMRILAPTKEPRGRINAVDATVANVLPWRRTQGPSLGVARAGRWG